MPSDPHYEHYNEDVAEPVPRLRDAAIDTAKSTIIESIFNATSEEVFYQRQIEILLEDHFFHWITTKALKELAQERRLETELVELSNNNKVRFYWLRKNRYFIRKRKEIQSLIEEHAGDNQATGDHGEMMFDAALPRFGFLPTAINVNSHKGKRWTKRPIMTSIAYLNGMDERMGPR